MLDSQRDMTRMSDKFLAVNTLPEIPVFSYDPTIATKYEERIAQIMHDALIPKDEEDAEKIRRGPPATSTRFLIMDELAKNPFSTIRQIAENIAKDRSATHRMLTKMRKEGVVDNVMRKVPTSTRCGVSRAGVWFLTEAQQ